MGLLDATKVCLSKYFTFSGRASRPEYWWFLLFVVVVSIILEVVDAMLFGEDAEAGGGQTVLSGLFQLAMFIPLLSAGWRRLHDSGKPGWYIILPTIVSLIFMVGMVTGFLALGVVENHVLDAEEPGPGGILLAGGGLIIFAIIQIVVAVLMLWWLTRPSDSSDNRYGPVPSEVTVAKG